MGVWVYHEVDVEAGRDVYGVRFLLAEPLVSPACLCGLAVVPLVLSIALRCSVCRGKPLDSLPVVSLPLTLDHL